MLKGKIWAETSSQQFRRKTFRTFGNNNNNNTFRCFWIRGGFCKKKKSVDLKILSSWPEISGEWSGQRELQAKASYIWGGGSRRLLRSRLFIIGKPLWVADPKTPLLTLSFGGVEVSGLPDAKAAWDQLLVHQVKHSSVTQKAHHKVSALFSS